MKFVWYIVRLNSTGAFCVWVKGSLYVSGKLPTYPSSKPTFCLKWEVSVNAGLGEGWVDSFQETLNEKEHDTLKTLLDKNNKRIVLQFYLHCRFIFKKYIFPFLFPISYKR